MFSEVCVFSHYLLRVHKVPVSMPSFQLSVTFP